MRYGFCGWRISLLVSTFVCPEILFFEVVGGLAGVLLLRLLLLLVVFSLNRLGFRESHLVNCFVGINRQNMPVIIHRGVASQRGVGTDSWPNPGAEPPGSVAAPESPKHRAFQFTTGDCTVQFKSANHSVNF